MIMIQKFFNENVLNEYYDYIIGKFQKGEIKPNSKNITIGNKTNDFQVPFLPDVSSSNNKMYTISFKTLIKGIHKEVMGTDGMDLYMDICRLHYCCSRLDITEKTFLKRLYWSYSSEIDKEDGDKSDEPKYYFKLYKTPFSVQITSNSIVKDFDKVISFITDKLKSKDTILYDSYRKKSWKKYSNNHKKQNLQFIPTSMTFEELKILLTLLFEETNNLLQANIKKRGGGIKTGKYIDYEHIGDNNRHKLVDSLGIKTCPYCNRQYITSWISRNKGKTTADLDHYYQKAWFPLFSMSAFNFIPSCHVCNSLMKGDKYAETLYPYKEATEEYVKFAITLKADQKPKKIVDIWLGKGKDSFSDIKQISELSILNLFKEKDKSNLNESEIEILSLKEKMIDNEIELFNLNELYRNHLDQAINVLLIMRIYLEENFYTKNINSICRNIGISSVKNGSSITKEEIRCFLLGLVSDGQGEMDNPLAKLISDIYNSEVDNILELNKNQKS